ncbi:MAG: glycerol-3-phosphate dehydrogenase [Rhodospirillaceae bacterium]|jgi:glycerol-3-phosphate dehydrogenase subunit C|nr:glycerol-3-phosphate dehydrogenase [Rhodospirillaceae bacterium]MBT4688016.1 glycerol-3-phosphate dehydrogenase [Rhodospirillaceae bacterium]MBT5083470.1 glycerol-3-phosphate dehydrogenase [Rhodospirillaceae bacterium]MBT5527259.1 glycerol-3-phosphate dehydrogenase [Rhodospirillaceae bacterium]MBT5879984.1 glycerol-3-phosphate dehydrogenase [Rhodospirillaceae bacterium]
MSKEGSLEAPTRHPIPWTEPDFLDPGKIDAEVRRVFDICHGCRRCFNLCDSFPRLFDLIDDSPSGELDTVHSNAFADVVDACTFCDMCYMTKCPYVPPHEFNLDFPHLMLRYRAAERAGTIQGGGVGFQRKQLSKTDRNGKWAGKVAGLANWATAEGNFGMRNMLEDVAGIHRDAALPKFNSETFLDSAKTALPLNAKAPSHGRKAVIYATCFANFNEPAMGAAARSVLAHNGVETAVAYPSCCGMPSWEQGDLEQVAANARKVAGEMADWIDQGYAVIALVPSCALMLKSEWPLLLPGDEAVRRLSENTYDITEYMVSLAKEDGLADGLTPLSGGVTLHLACHARAQNMGAKGAEMLRLIPDTEVTVVERCSGHGGAWGIMKENFDVALKVGKPAARQALKPDSQWVVSECPLAADHLRQGMERLADNVPQTVPHPIILLAQAYGL